MTLDPFVAIFIMVGGIITICLIGLIIYTIMRRKIEKTSSTSIPKGSDDSDIGRMLQEKYQQERDSGDFKQNLL